MKLKLKELVSAERNGQTMYCCFQFFWLIQKLVSGLFFERICGKYIP